ncbi:MAG: 50S ribosomal protein L25/general stress protein Ctc [Pygmaiobacter sp.]
MYILAVESRDAAAKAHQLRRAGVVPCVISGGLLPEAISVQITKMASEKLFKSNRQGSRIQIKLNDQVIPVQIKEKAWNSLGTEITHICFQALKADQKVNSVVHIILQNPEKVLGSLEKMLLEIPYAAFPEDMIDTIAIDLEGLPMRTVVTVGDLAEFKTGKLELLVDTDSIIFRTNEKKGALPVAVK